ncbi:SapB/AmfS family lanthipeptide [Lentzea sp. NPDC055074]|nr:SapB/AmfS family lanthipeptide [Streptomyces sp. ID05-26A]
MGFILDMQDLETPEAPATMMAGGSGGGGGGGSTTASTVSLLLPCSHSGASLLLC